MPADATTPRRDLVPLAAGVAALLVVAAVQSSWTGDGVSGTGLDVLWTLAVHAPIPLLWCVAAYGFGWPLRRWLMRSGGPAIQFGLGVAGLLVADAALGALGVLQAAGGIAAWGLVTVGAAMTVVQIARGPRRDLSPVWPWLAAPAVATLLVAACSAPGWLWASEFGGYDALSYHLQLPKEWLAAGHIAPGEYNVYGFLPGYVEAAYYHLAILYGDAVQAAYACQLLHAALTVGAAATIGALALRLSNARGGAFAWIIAIGTPWCVVVGSLAYNDIVPVLMLAAAWCVIEDDDSCRWRRGVALGLLAGAAAGAKLTAVGFVGVPIGLLVIARRPQMRSWSATILMMAIAGLITLGPYVVRNTVACGNPVFPFATGVFGAAHWSDEQVTIWNDAHQPRDPIGERLVHGWHEGPAYGFGTPPNALEPWKPQWSLLPWIGMAGLIVLASSSRHRRTALLAAVVLAAQLVFWIAMTHVKSRFMLASVVPLSLATALALNQLYTTLATRNARLTGIVTSVVLALWSFGPAMILRSERGGAPAAMAGRLHLLTGHGLSPGERTQVMRLSLPTYLNYGLSRDAKVLLVGDATPFLYDADLTYTTTWDRGPISDHPPTVENDRWLDALRAAGYTHVVVNRIMLSRWISDGWAGPNLDDAAVIAALELHANRVRAFGEDVIVYEVPAATK